MEKPLVPLMCGDCKRPVMDHTVAIELCSECDELRCGDCASVVSGRFVCWACQPRLAARLETRRAAGAAPSRTASTPTFAHSPPGPKSPKPGLLDRFLASASGSDEQARREREAKRVLRAKLEREERMRECGRTWKEEVIPHWVKTATSRKVRDLCWQGIPPSLRKDVWPLLIGNRLSISPELFEIHGGRAFEVRNLSSTGQLNLAESDQHSNKEQSVLLIPVDIGRTFPLLGFFQEEGPQHEELRHVLEAYVCLRPDIGYVQGMSFIAAVFLLNMDCYTSFQCLANVLNRKIFLEFFRMNMIQIRKYMLVLEELMGKHLPKIAKRFEDMRLTPDMYIVDWVLTLFSKALPLDLAMRVWDYFFFEGTRFIFRVALGILKYGSPVLESGEFEECLTWLTHLNRANIVEADLFECIKSISFSRSQCAELFGKYNLEV